MDMRLVLSYVRLGLSLIPLKIKSKEPLIPWAEFQRRKATVDEVRGWLLKWPLMNLGVVTGSISGLAVVDLDGPEGLKSATALGLKSSVVSLTGNGRQLWYAHPGQHVTGSIKLHPGLDIRGDGNYVVAPPSTHPSGRRYRWLGSPNLAIVVTKLPSFPTTLLCAAADGPAEVSKSQNEFKPKLDIAKLLEEMKIGNIDDTLFKICARLRNDGYSEADTLVLLTPHADRVGATPGHLEDKIRNVWARYEPKRAAEYGGSVYETNRNGGSLQLHSPTNPDSLKQYMDSKRSSDSETKWEKLRCGFERLDAHLSKGLHSSRVFTIAARTGTGKTNFALSLSRSLTEAGKRVLYFSTETPFTEIWDRFKYLKSGPDIFESQPFTVCDGFTPSLAQVEEAIKEVKPDVFIFDHINHVAEDVKPLAEFMKGCNFLQRQYNCQGIIMAQLNRSADWVENGKRVVPRMSMIKGAGAIEQGSSRVLLLSEERVIPEGSEIVGVLDKNDNGTKGMLTFMLKKYPHWHFEEV